MKLAVMQPYFFPYLGYFQLINASDTFVFYDDVQYMVGGWINRNRILINDTDKYITIPCKNASPNRLINEVCHFLNDRLRDKLIRKVSLAYKNAPYFQDVFPIIRDVIYTEKSSISDLAIASVSKTLEYLEMDTPLKQSSLAYYNQKLKGEERVMDICKQENATVYINAVGGKKLYSREAFLNRGIELKFLNTSFSPYKQFAEKFVPGLSIIDVLMFNSISMIHKMLDRYDLE